MIKVSVAIIEKNEQILLCQRKRNSKYALKWEFPGGKVKENESLEECLKRELKEELNIGVEVGEKILTKVNVYSDGGIFEVSYFLIDSYRGKIRNKIFEKIIWAYISEIFTLDFLKGNEEIINILYEKR